MKLKFMLTSLLVALVTIPALANTPVPFEPEPQPEPLCSVSGFSCYYDPSTGQYDGRYCCSRICNVSNYTCY
jgi:hypothetical protein